MSRQCLIVGQPNAGKTLFVLQLAESCGIKNVEIRFQSPGGFLAQQRYPITVARQELVNHETHTTRQLQSLTIELQVGKGTQSVNIIDTVGLIDGVHPNENLRLAMVQTLKALQQADIAIHIIDAYRVAKDGVNKGLASVDFQLAKYLQSLGNYFICANKIDLHNAEHGVALIQAAFPDNLVLPISASSGVGFSEVKKYVKKML